MALLHVLVGPTASGKSAVSLEVARALDAEILSLDSMQLYRGMDIGTDKPRETRGIRHHLIDCLDPGERFDLRRYLAMAERAIGEIATRGKRVLVVGGTGLYLMGLLKGVFEHAPRDDRLRARLSKQDLPALFARLREVDPASAGKIHAHDRRRITRALEVYQTTGRPLSELQTQFAGPDRHTAIIAGLALERALLKQRIEARVDAMIANGLAAEVRALRLGPTAAQAVGYKEILAHQAGAFDLAEARRRIVRNSLRLARRQQTWFRRFEIHWADATAPDLAARLIQFFRGATTE